MALGGATLARLAGALIVAAAAPAAVAQQPAKGPPPGAAMVEVPGAAWGAPASAARGPTAAIRVRRGRDGRLVLDGHRSSDPDGRIVAHEWDLDGDGTFETAGAVVRPALDAGEATVRLRVTDDAGATAEASRTVRAARPESPLAAADEPAPAADRPRARAEGPAPAEPAADRPPARAAQGGSAVTILDFRFSPRSITVDVGDTVTWTNRGPTEHTATARDGSFDTGLLSRGESGSHTFRSAGTVAYICTPHPFMRATVRVLAADADPGGDSGSGPPAAGDEAAPAAPSGGLPDTGGDLGPIALAGALLLAAGLALRPQRRRGPSRSSTSSSHSWVLRKR